MATQIVCPRCKGSLMPNARACPRCGLVLPQAGRDQSNNASNVGNSLSYPTQTAPGPPVMPPTQPQTHSGAPTPASLNGGGSQAHEGYIYERGGGSGPLILRGEQSAPVQQQRGQTGPLPLRHGTGPLTPRGALELLPGESVAYQLGALYLTTKRVILLAPSVVRSAFVRDIDAVGTFTEKSSGWLLALGLFLLALSGGLVYATFDRQWESSFPFLYVVPPWTIGLAFGLISLYPIIRSFFWTKRTLFVSVKGRPLITVSISDWSQKRLDGMDEFVNAFFQIKDFMTGELGGVEYQ